MTNSNPSAKNSDIREALIGLLESLGADSEAAWSQYDLIRRKLVKFFECNQCQPSEDHADEVLDRLGKRSNLSEIRDIPSFAVGVARKVCLEHRKKAKRTESYDAAPEGEQALVDPHDYQADLVQRLDDEARLQCLKNCLAGLPAAERDAVLEYHDDEGKLHKRRRALGERLGLKMGTLRVRMNRTREKLERDVKHCLEEHRKLLRTRGSSAS